MSNSPDTAEAASGAHALVTGALDLVSLPEVAATVIRMAQDPQSTAAQLAKVIQRDPNLAARVLRIANSSYYPLRGRIATIQRAVTVIGSRQLSDLVIGLSTLRAFRGIPVEFVSMEGFWVHSLYCAVLARMLARTAIPGREETAMLAGLLHDVGQLLIFLKRPEEARKALWMATEGPDDFTSDAGERAMLGFDHGDVGDKLARRWNLPDELRESMAYHHSPARASASCAPVVAIVHVANSLAYLAETDSLEIETGPPIDAEAARLAHFDPARIPELVAESRAQIDETRFLFGL